MNEISRILALGLAWAMLLGLATPARAEVIEEIVAWVNGEIITRSDLGRKSRR